MTAHLSLSDLRAFRPQHDYFVGIDSDGTIFDSMEIKHKDSFIGNLIKHFGFAAITHHVHEVWNYVNIFSQTRGTNRFKALLLVIDYLQEIDAVKQVEISLPDLQYVREWVQKESAPSNINLQTAIAASSGVHRKELEKVLAWSNDVNQTIKEVVYNLPPMPGAFKSLKLLNGRADLIVISNTPLAALHREWQEHRIINTVSAISGQETGSKTEMLTAAAADKYPLDHILLIGDSPGDLHAAQYMNTLFFPIIPRQEAASWQLFLAEGIDRFFDGCFTGPFQDERIANFHTALSNSPPWQP